MSYPVETLFNKYQWIDSPGDNVRPSMPCREFKVDKRSRGPIFGKYVHLKGRTSLHARYMRHFLPLILPLKGRTSLRMRDMRHLPLPIWECEICTIFPFRFGRRLPTFHVKRIPFLSDKRRSLQKIRYAL